MAPLRCRTGVRGLYRFYEELALRFAEAGVDALAIDYFGRTAGVGKRDNDFDKQPHLDQVSWEGVIADATAGVERLRKRGRHVRAVFSVGFCMGGRFSFLMGTRDELGVVGFYGPPLGPIRYGGSPAPADVADRIGCSVLGLFGGADSGIPPESVEEFRARLTQAGVDHDLVVFPGAPHSFFDKKQAEFSADSEDAWSACAGVRHPAHASRDRVGQAVRVARSPSGPPGSTTVAHSVWGRWSSGSPIIGRNW